jgi:hypothetical protein
MLLYKDTITLELRVQDTPAAPYRAIDRIQKPNEQRTTKVTHFQTTARYR